MGHHPGGEGGESRGFMRTIGHGDRGGSGVGGHLQVMRGIADHQRALRLDTKLAHQLHQHPRVGLGAGFVSCAGAIEHVAQLHVLQRFVQALAALAGGHGQPVLPRLEHGQHLQRALEQAELVLTGEVVVAVAQSQLGHACRIQGWGDMGQRIVQAQADHVGRRLARGHRQAQVGAGGLDAAGDQGGRVEQGAIPVEHDEIELAGAVGVHGGHRQVGRLGMGQESQRLAAQAR